MSSDPDQQFLNSQAADPHRNALVALDFKLTNYLAICDDRYIPCRGRQLVRSVARSTHPSTFMFWLSVFILITRDVALHERLFNLLTGTIMATALCTCVKLLVRRPRPIVPGGHQGKGLSRYSFPSGHASMITLAWCAMARAYQNDTMVMVLMGVLTAMVCLSMVMLGRQYVVDELGGCCVGIITHKILVKHALVSSATSEAYIKLTQDKLHI